MSRRLLLRAHEGRRAPFHADWPALLCLGALLWLGVPGSARAELTVQEERGVQIAAISTGYAFGAFHTALSIAALVRGEPLDRSWVAGSFMSAISFVGVSLGYLTLAAGFSADPDDAVTYGLSAPPGLMLGAFDLAVAIDAISRGDGNFWMAPEPAVVTLFHGLALSTLGSILAFGANSGSSDLSKIAPLYTWAVGGALLAIYATLSLIIGAP